MNWKNLYFGKISRDEIQDAIKDDKWQEVRKSMKGIPLKDKYSKLKGWLQKSNYSRKSKVQVTNYVTALSRGGLIKPKDYLGDK